MFSAYQQTESKQEKCENEALAANQVPKSSSKSSLRSKSSRSSLKLESGTASSAKKDTDSIKVCDSKSLV